jgi:heptosyltransferase-2
MAQQLRNRGYRTVYVIPTSYKAAVVPFLAGIPERIGWSDEFRFILINRLRFGLRRMDRILDEIGALGVPAGEDPPEQWPAPRLVVPPALQAEVEQIRATAASDRPVIAFAPGSAESRRMWPVAAFAELARRCQQRGWTVWVVGAGWEREIATQIGEGTGARDLTRTSVTSLALTLAAADVFVGNNSGPLHIAAGFGKPSIAVFGSPLAFFGAPINPGVRVVEAPFAAARMHRHHLRWPSVDAVDAALTEAVESLPAKAGESWSPAVVPL